MRTRSVCVRCWVQRGAPGRSVISLGKRPVRVKPNRRILNGVWWLDTTWPWSQWRGIFVFLGFPIFTAADTLRQLRTASANTEKPHPGRPHKLSDGTKRCWLTNMRKSRTAATIDFRPPTSHKPLAQLFATTRTSHWEPHVHGYQARSVAHKACITPGKARRLLQWYLSQRSKITEEWKRVKWADKSCFSL